MPRPTTVKPMTEPEEIATRRPRLRLAGGVGRAGVGGRRYPHADEARKAGVEPACHKGEGYELRKQGPARLSRGTKASTASTTAMIAKMRPTVLYWRFEVCVRALAYGRRYLLHERCAFWNIASPFWPGCRQRAAPITAPKMPTQK